MWPNPQFPADFVTFSEEILNGKCYFLSSECYIYRTSTPKVLLGKGVLQICSKFTGEHPFWSVISIKLLWSRRLQKQPSRRVLRKRCSANMQQIYSRTPIPKCNFNKVEGPLLHLVQSANSCFTPPLCKHASVDFGSTRNTQWLKSGSFFSSKSNT